MPNSKINLSVVIPCYNEAKNIPILLKRFAEVIKRQKIEVILVNNGSTDETEQIISNLLPKYLFARSVRVKINKGYGFGILQGLKAAEGRYLGWTHADMQTDPSDVVRAYKIIEQSNFSQNIFVKGKRLSRLFSDVFFTFFMGVYESFLLGTILSDINGQPTIFSRTFYETWKNPPLDFALDLYCYALAKKRRLTIVRLPVLFPKRIHGSSSWNTGLLAKWKLIKRTVGFSWKLRREVNNSPEGMPFFIAHRINTVAELEETPAHFGVEVDLRDRDGKLFLQHEPFIGGDNFEEYLKHYHHGTMILNIKSERIEHKVIDLLKKYDIRDYFFLDSSFPMIHTLSKEGEKNIALRYSEYESLESVLKMQGRARWVWVDCFHNFPLDKNTYDQLKLAGFKLCLVSPELQGRDQDIEIYKEQMKNEGIIFDAICTKSFNAKRWIQ